LSGKKYSEKWKKKKDSAKQIQIVEKNTDSGKNIHSGKNRYSEKYIVEKNPNWTKIYR